MKNEHKIALGIPSKRLAERVVLLFKQAGYDLNIDDLSMTASLDDEETQCYFGSDNEIAQLIKEGHLDAGIVRKTALEEASIVLPEISNLGCPISYADESKLVLGVPLNSSIKSLRDLNGKKIITRRVNIARTFLKQNKISATIIPSEGTNEAKVAHFADAIIDFLVTGSLFKAYRLRVLHVIMQDFLLFVVSPKAMKNSWKREKIENLVMLLKGASLAQIYSGIMLHAPKPIIKKVIAVMPALKKPTITSVEGTTLFDVFTVVLKKELRSLIPTLKKLGCSDLVEFSLNKVIL